MTSLANYLNVGTDLMCLAFNRTYHQGCTQMIVVNGSESIERHLREAEEMIASARHRILKQNRIIDELRAKGHDSIAAEALLYALVEMQALHEEYRDWLRYKRADKAPSILRELLGHSKTHYATLSKPNPMQPYSLHSELAGC